MLDMSDRRLRLVGPAGTLDVPQEDEMIRKLSMLFEGECEGLGAVKAAAKYGCTKQRYYQIKAAFAEEGASALISKKRGPKSNYRRTPEVTRQIIRHRFLDPDASIEVIAQRINQCGMPISTASVGRVIEAFGLQKKTLQVSSRPDPDPDRDSANQRDQEA
jgi:transposase